MLDLPFNTARRQGVKTSKKPAAKVAKTQTSVKAKKPAVVAQKSAPVKAKAVLETMEGKEKSV